MNPNDLTPRQRKVTAAVSALLIGGFTYLYSGNLTQNLKGFFRPAAQAGLATTAAAVSYMTSPLTKKEDEEDKGARPVKPVAGFSPPRKNQKQPGLSLRRAVPSGKTENRGQRKTSGGRSTASVIPDRRKPTATPGGDTTVPSLPGNGGVKTSQTKQSSADGKSKASRNPDKRSGQVRVSRQPSEDGSLAVTLTFSGLSGTRFKQVVRHKLVSMNELKWSLPVNKGNGERSISTTIPKEANQEEVLQSIIATSGAEYKA